MKKLPTAFIFFLGVVLAGCAARDLTRENSSPRVQRSSPSFPTHVESKTYIIKKGDQVELSVWGYPEFSKTTIVKETGTIPVPLVGEVIAAGLTKEQFTEQLRAKLSEYIQGEVRLVVSILSSEAQKVAVLGAVIRQQSYPVTTDVSLLEILSTAGGTTPESDLEHIKIIRYQENTHPIEIDLSYYIENGNIEAIPLVRPGDTVFIPKRQNAVREVSDFMRDLIWLFGLFRLFN